MTPSGRLWAFANFSRFVRPGAFSYTLPARSLVTFQIPASSGSGAACEVTYTTQSQWTGGFVAAVTIGNTGSSAIDGWTLKFTFGGDQQITSAWNGSYTQSGGPPVRGCPAAATGHRPDGPAIGTGGTTDRSGYMWF